MATSNPLAGNEDDQKREVMTNTPSGGHGSSKAGHRDPKALGIPGPPPTGGGSSSRGSKHSSRRSQDKHQGVNNVPLSSGNNNNRLSVAGQGPVDGSGVPLSMTRTRSRSKSFNAKQNAMTGTQYAQGGQLQGSGAGRGPAPSSAEAVETGNEEFDKPHDWCFMISAILIQLITIIFYAEHTIYQDGNTVTVDTEVIDPTTNTTIYADVYPTDTSMDMYAVYQDVHVMIVVGFGFLMTFLRKYGFSSVSYNLLITAIALQWGLFTYLWLGSGRLFRLWELGYDIYDYPANVQADGLVDGDIAAAAVLISFGAVLGRTSPSQLLWMTFFELIIFNLNFCLCTQELYITDVGGSIVVHAFGAYFGLAVSYVLGEPNLDADNASVYHSDIFSMIGTTFLWIFWPSFNGFFGAQEGYFRDRAFVNTVLSLSACTISAFVFSKLFGHGKFDMVHVQNATLAGGVAVGAAADLYLHPVGAMVVGMIAGFLSVYGYAKIQYKLENYGLYDTCGVNNLHGMPGVMGAIVSAIAIWIAGGSNWYYYDAGCGEDENCLFYWDYGTQGFMQLAALACTLGFAIIGGALTGLGLKQIDQFNYIWNAKSLYQDKQHWII